MVVINAINFVDGLDGLATGIVMICAASFFAFSYLLAVINGLNRAGAPSLITAVVIGLCLGFLPHNFYPAQIFMGDSGAMFLGLLISASAITLTGQVDASAITQENGGNVLLPLLLPFTILAIPLLDFVMAIIRRVKAGRSPFDADREHLHHRIMRVGLTQQRTTIILYFWTAMFALPTVIAAFMPTWVAILVGAVIFGSSLMIIKTNRDVNA
jgi:UDP-GlcNAc:undecaprenyl-phosphate GlcNAc-1-phosphate transferase